MVLKHEATMTGIISYAVAIVLNAIIFAAASKVRKAGKE